MLSKNIIFITIISLVLFTSFSVLATDPGKVKVKITGTTINIAGEYDCVKCGDYFYPLENKGVLYEAKMDGWMLQLANGEERISGSQVRKNSEVTILLNGPGKYYGYDNRKAEGKINFSEDFKSASIKVTLKNVINPKDIVEVEAEFSCN
jgi:hypothetical protein